MSKNQPVAQRMQKINPFYVMDILAQARKLESEGHDVIHLEVGEPDFDTPQRVKDAAKQAIDADKTFYTQATGLPELKQKISNYYQQRLGTKLNAENIVLTPGASGALQLALSVTVNPGQNVLMADPGYPCNRHFVRLLEAQAKVVNVGPETQYQLTHELIDQNWDEHTAAVLIASPANPTGTIITSGEMQKIIRVVRKHGGVLLVDEIYQGLVYGADDFTVLAFIEDQWRDVFVINSFSKYFSMTGWRLGWLVVPDTYLASVERLAQNLYLAPATVSQYAALSAFDDENLAILDAQRDELHRRRDFLFDGLTQLGFNIAVKPEGAFYIYANIEKFSSDSFSFCEQLLEQAHVAITPGLDFGDYHPQFHVRFAYTQSIGRLSEALERIRVFLQQV